MKLVDKILLEFINTSNLTEQEFFSYCWLFFIAYPYSGTMNINSWAKDKRFGNVICNDAMNWLSKRGLISITDTQYKVVNLEKAKNVVKNIFGVPTSFEDLDEKIKELKSKNYKSEFPIFTIPESIFDDERHKATFKQNTLTDYDYVNIERWLKKYEREPLGWNNKLTKLIGKVGELIIDKPYTLYRGLYFPFKNFDVKEGEVLNLPSSNKNLSWTQDQNIAISFSKGKNNYQAKERLFSGDTGIVLKHTFNPNQLFLDLEFISEHNPYISNIIDFPSELEVIIAPTKQKFTIWKVFHGEGEDKFGWRYESKFINKILVESGF